MGKKLLAVLGLSGVQKLLSKKDEFSPSKYNCLVIFNVKVVPV